MSCFVLAPRTADPCINCPTTLSPQLTVPDPAQDPEDCQITGQYYRNVSIPKLDSRIRLCLWGGRTSLICIRIRVLYQERSVGRRTRRLRTMVVAERIDAALLIAFILHRAARLVNAFHVARSSVKQSVNPADDYRMPCRARYTIALYSWPRSVGLGWRLPKAILHVYKPNNIIFGCRVINMARKGSRTYSSMCCVVRC